jgi:uncharacterized membrane protein
VVRWLALGAAVWLIGLIAAPFLPVPVSAAIYTIGALVCHQRPDRSFDIAGLQLPVCARCLGLYGGAAVGAWAAPFLGRIRRPRMLVIVATLPALTSLIVEWIGLYRPSNAIRAVTGVIAGGIVAAVVLATLHYERCAPRRPIAPNRPPTPI